MPYKIPFLGKTHQHVNVIALRLDLRKTVFGEALRGIEVIDKIAAAARDDRDNPLEPIRMTETLKE